MNVRYMPHAHIDGAAISLLNAYGRQHGQITQPPVPADEILECHLRLSLLFDDLRKKFDDPSVLGAMRVDRREVLIDQSLDPYENPSLKGRYRFTVAHEVGHWTLHREQMEMVRSAPLFDGEKGPSIICRSSRKKPPIEWQADCFAACLLMPVEMVRAQWESITGSRQPYVAEKEIENLERNYGLTDTDQPPAVEVAKRMSHAFEVSAQAMQIRLVELNLILTKQPPRTLFG